MSESHPQLSNVALNQTEDSRAGNSSTLLKNRSEGKRCSTFLFPIRIQDKTADRLRWNHKAFLCKWTIKRIYLNSNACSRFNGRFLKRAPQYSVISCTASFKALCECGTVVVTLTVAAALTASLLTVNERMMYEASVFRLRHFHPSASWL